MNRPAAYTVRDECTSRCWDGVNRHLTILFAITALASCVKPQQPILHARDLQAVLGRATALEVADGSIDPGVPLKGRQITDRSVLLQMARSDILSIDDVTGKTLTNAFAVHIVLREHDMIIAEYELLGPRTIAYMDGERQKIAQLKDDQFFRVFRSTIERD